MNTKHKSYRFAIIVEAVFLHAPFHQKHAKNRIFWNEEYNES